MNILRKVKDKEITDTFFYNPKWQPDRSSKIPVREQGAENIKRFNLYSDVIEAICDGYISGFKSIENDHVNYQKLALTEKGEEFLKLMNTPINSILKPTWFEVITKNVIGRIIAVILVPFIIYTFNYFFPSFAPNFWRYFKTLISVLSQ